MLPLKNLLRRKLRSLFALLQIAVAIAAFVAIQGVVEGLRGQFYRLGEVFAFDLVVQARGAASPIFSQITREDAAKAATVPGVAEVSLLRVHFMRSPKLAQPLGFLAMDPGSELMRRHQVVRGRELTKQDTNQILVGEQMAQDLGLDTSALVEGGVQGEPPVLELEGGMRLPVVGVFRSPVSDVPFLSGQAVMQLGWLQRVARGEAHLLFVHREPGARVSDPDDVRPTLAATMALAPAVDAALPRLEAKTIDKFLDTFKQTKLIDDFAKAILFLAALVSGIGVANTMLMSVFDRTREIGLLRAIGWSRLRIVAMIEAEGVLLAVGGGLLGMPLGLLFVRASTLIVKMGWLSVSIDPLLYVEAVGAAMLIGLLGSCYPALRAAYLEPTEALRYE
ncbi:MAG: ABC transporter permease [Planctomycetota bacterium]